MKKTSKSILILVILLLFLFCFLLNSEIMIQSFLDYSFLFLTKVFPTSFIFFLFSSLLIQYGVIEFFCSIFPIKSGSFYVLLLSLISGFPSGAKYTKELLEKGVVQREEANQILLFSHFPNPLFVIGSLTSLLEKEIAWKLLFSIILSNFFLFVFSKKELSTSVSFHSKESFAKVLKESIYKTIDMIILIYGTSCFFCVFLFLLTKYLSFSPCLYVFVCGIFDLTKGIFSTGILSSMFLRASFILLFLSFGSFSIHFQVQSILLDSSLSYRFFLLGRILGTILSFILFFILFFL